MGKSRIAIPRVGIGLRSPLPRVNHVSYTVKRHSVGGQELAFPSGDEADDDGSTAAGNRVMVVLDSSLDTEGALEWTLSHAVQTHHDCIVLLQVVKPFNKGEIMRPAKPNYLQKFPYSHRKLLSLMGGRAQWEVQPPGP